MGDRNHKQASRRTGSGKVSRGGVVMVSDPVRPKSSGLGSALNGTRRPAQSEDSDSNTGSDVPDPEALRIRDELTRLHQDPDARRAFYDDLRRTVQQVRAGAKNDDDSKDTSNPSDERVHPSRRTETPPDRIQPANSTSPAIAQPNDKRDAHPESPEALLDFGNGTIDRKSYLIVVRWAKANGTPVSLALGVAWMESHLNAHPARGAAGEVGMFQIMPSRCELEGWPARRLKEPEFNAWLGTLLLARYYQEEGSVARAAAKYVAGPGVFEKKYSKDMWAYINWYAHTVDGYASYFAHYEA